MKLKAGVAKGRDLAFRRENNLRILNGVFDVVLFQNSAGDNTTRETQFPEVGNTEALTGSRETSKPASEERRGSQTELGEPEFK